MKSRIPDPRRTIALYLVAGVLAMVAGVIGGADGQLNVPLLAASAFCFAMAAVHWRRGTRA